MCKAAKTSKPGNSSVASDAFFPSFLPRVRACAPHQCPVASSLAEHDAIAAHLLLERAVVRAEAAAAQGNGAQQQQQQQQQAPVEGLSLRAHAASLPARVDMPLFWTPEEMAELQASSARPVAERLREELKEEHAALLGTLRAEAAGEAAARACGAFDDYLWARAMLWSRGERLNIEAAPEAEGAEAKTTKVLLMTPFFDLFNHSAAISAGDSHRVVRGAGGELCVRAVATRDYAAGEEVCISYGQHSNRQLLLSYGFVLEAALPAATAKESAKGRSFDCAELSLSLPVASADEGDALRSAPDACGLDGDGSDGAHTWAEIRAPSGDEWAARNEAAAEAERTGAPPPLPLEFEVTHTLHARRPLTDGLLGMARVRALASAAPDGRLDAAAARAAGDVAFERRALPPREEVAALTTVLSLLRGVAAQYATTMEADAEALAADQGAANSLPPRRRAALIVRLGEKRVLHAAGEEARAKLRKLVRGVRRLAIRSTLGKCGTCPQCAAARSPWIHRLRSERTRVEGSSDSVSKTSKLLFDALPRGDVALLDAAHAPFAWMVDRVACLPLGDKATPLAEAPFDPSEVDPAASDAAKGNEGDVFGPAGAYLRLYADKMTRWGSWFTAQWAHCGMYGMDELSALGAEIVELRQAHAWSVPSEAALAVLADLGPLVEVGAGRGLWAAALRQRGCDVLAFSGDELDASFGGEGAANQLEGGDRSMEDGAAGIAVGHVQRGGPEVLAGGAHDGRALVLMWPDYGGKGRFGLECVRSYGGARLALCGEWRGATLGDYAEGLPAETGQSFSAEVQAFVEEHFEREREVALPRWPLCCDKLMIWRRRATGTV